MAGTRRSTRQSTSNSAPKYAEESSSSSSEKGASHNGTKSARRKRARENDEEGQSTPKRVMKPKAKPASKSALPKPPKKTAAPPSAPLSDTNRDATGNQEVYWLLKAEPLPRYENGVNVAFSIDDLKACKQPEPWTGVRNPQARNNMQAMRTGDLGFFYHSNAKPSGVVGILRIVEEAKVDETAFDDKDPYFDPKSDKEKPKWFCVGVEFVRKFDHVVDLHKIKSFATSGGPLEGMQLVTNGRLSVCKVMRQEWDFIMGLAEGKGGGEEE